MDGDQFDALARALGSGRSRRGVLKGLGAAALGTMGIAGLESGVKAAVGQVSICHRTGSASNPYQYTTVAASAVPMHQAHGDVISPNFATDPANCGACGIVCANDQCIDSTCVTVQTATSIMSDVGIPWVDGLGASGSSAFTYGHNGCGDIDAEGFCTFGVWPTLSGAHWIFKTQNVTDAEANYGTPIITFRETFSLPQNAGNTSGTLQITADNAF